MCKATPAEKKRAKKARKNRHKRRMRAAAARKRAERWWHEQGRRAGHEPELDPWPDTTGLSDEEAACVMGEFFYWEDYFDRNPDSKFGAPM